jgi:putative ABC transport system permease protein
MIRADLRRNLVSQLAVLLLLAFAFSGTIATGVFERALEKAGARAASGDDLVIGAPGSSLDLVLATVYLRSEDPLPLLPWSVVEKLAADPRAAAVCPLAFADHYLGFPIVGAGAGLEKLRPSLRIATGSWPADPAAPFEAVVGAATGLPLGESFNGAHGVHETEGVEAEKHEEAAYHVAGILAPTGTPWDRAIIVPIAGIWKLHEATVLEPDKRTKVSAILVKPRDFPAAYALRAAYKEGGTTAAFPGEVLASLFGLMQDVKAALSALTVAFQVIVLVAVVLGLLASLPSKARWIALLRSLGAGRAYVFATLWIQSGLVFLLAGILGLVLGYGGAVLLATYVEASSGLSLACKIGALELLWLGLFWLAGLLGSLLPAIAGFRRSVRSSLLAEPR